MPQRGNVIDLPVRRRVTPIPPERLHQPIGAPATPPDRYMVPPDDLGPDTKITVVLDGPDVGRVYGRVAPRDQCLLSMPDQCWTISDSPTNFAGAMQGETILDDGRVVPTGTIAGRMRHANLDWSFTAAVDWYENTGSKQARVRYGADDHGIWLAGAAVASLTYAQAIDLMESPVSGDWRWRPELDAYDMAGAMLVNQPGFPLGVKSRAASTWGEALVGTWVEVKAMVASMFGHSDTVGEEPHEPEDDMTGPNTCTCGTAATAAAGDETPEAEPSFTRAEVEELIAAAVAPYADRLAQVEGTVATLSELAVSQLDASMADAG